MTDKEHTHDCDCQNGECECEHSNVITLDMEDGSQKDFEILHMLEFEGGQYIALAEPESNEYDILRIELEGDTADLIVIEDDALFDRVAQAFDDFFQNGDAEEEDAE